MKLKKQLLVEKKGDFLKRCFKQDEFWEQPDWYWEDRHYRDYWYNDYDYYDNQWKYACESGNLVQELEKSDDIGSFTWEDITKSTKRRKKYWKRN